MFKTYQELICHFHICLGPQCSRDRKWDKSLGADYLFFILDYAPKDVQFPIMDEDIAWVMAASGHGDVILDEGDGIYERGNRFNSFHHQASQPMSRKALLAGYLSVWQKKCMVSSPLCDGILSWVLFSVVQVAYGKPLRLLPAKVCCIQRGLPALTEAFCRRPATKRGKRSIQPCDRPCPRVKFLYTYLMVWFALH